MPFLRKKIEHRHEETALHSGRLPFSGVGSGRHICAGIADHAFPAAEFVVVLSQLAPVARSFAPFPLVRPLSAALPVEGRSRLAHESGLPALHVDDDMRLRIHFSRLLACPGFAVRIGGHWHLHDSFRRAQF